MIKSAICEMLGIEYPVFQGGMAWIADGKLAAAVSNGGGLGIIAAGNAPGDYVRQQIQVAKRITNKPIGVNIMLLNPNADEVAKIVVEEGIQAVTTGAGNPEKYMPMWKEAGVKVIPVVASVAMAKRMERYGADAVVAEGMEAGGHIGNQTTMALIPQIVDAVNIPVIAAGGIGDGRGVAASFMLGAEGVQMGTRFVVADESIVHDNYKDRIVKAKDIDSVVTGQSTGHPVRCLRNQMTKEYIKKEQEGVPFEELERMTLGSLRKAVMEGDILNGTVMAGQIAGLVSKRQSCKEHLGRQKVSGQSTDRGCTETASHPTANLGRNAYGIAMLVLHPYTLDHVTICQLKQILLCTVNPGCLYIYHLQCCDRIFFQFFPQAFGKIGHLIIRSNKVFMQPAVNLLRTKRLISQSGHQFL